MHNDLIFLSLMTHFIKTSPSFKRTIAKHANFLARNNLVVQIVLFLLLFLFLNKSYVKMPVSA